MSERRFVIREWNLADPNPGWTITESELLRRLELTRHAFSDSEDVEPKYTIDEAIDIMVYGEKEGDHE